MNDSAIILLLWNGRLPVESVSNSISSSYWSLNPLIAKMRSGEERAWVTTSHSSLTILKRLSFGRTLSWSRVSTSRFECFRRKAWASCWSYTCAFPATRQLRVEYFPVVPPKNREEYLFVFVTFRLSCRWVFGSSQSNHWQRIVDIRALALVPATVYREIPSSVGCEASPVLVQREPKQILR